MKQVKLTAGILGVLAAAYFLLISGRAMVWNVLTASGHINGVLGIVIAVLLLAGSVIRICTHSAQNDEGSLVSLVLFAVAAAIAFASTRVYSYMGHWAILCLVMAILSVGVITWRNAKLTQQER